MVHASAAVAPQRLHAQEVHFQPEVEVSEIYALVSNYQDSSGRLSEQRLCRPQ